MSNSPYHFDTYASLLYKSGKKNEAIAAQQKAIELARSNSPADLATLEKTLEKMKAGEKTWN